MEFNRRGDGPVQIVLVPGGPGLTPDFYAELTAGLSESFEVVTYYPTGSLPTASSDFPREMTEYAAEARDLAAAAAVEDKPQVLMGHSFGVPVVIEALLGKNNASGAILLDGFDSAAMFNAGMGEKRQNLPPAFHANYDQLELESLSDLLPLLAEYFYPRHFCRLDPWPQSFLDGLNTLNMELVSYWLGNTFFELDGAISGWDRSSFLDQIEVPTLVVSGRYDYYREEDTQRLASNLPRGEAWISPTASHSPWVEDPQGFFAAVERFLGAFR